jgi:hypothetical protein
VHEEFVLGEGEAQRCFDLRISPLYDRGGRLTGRLVVLRDITKREQAEEALRRAEAETRRHLKEQIALREAGTIIASTLDLAEVLARIAEQMGLVLCQV